MNQTFFILQMTLTQAIKRLWVRLFPDGRRALEKRRLERLLRDSGLSKSEALGIVHRYFNG